MALSQTVHGCAHLSTISSNALKESSFLSSNAARFNAKSLQNGVKLATSRPTIFSNLNDDKLSRNAKGSKGGVGFGTPEKKVSKEENKSAPKQGGESIKRFPSPEKPLISTVAKSEAQIQSQGVDSIAVASLGILFAIIILQGLVLAISGFLPEEWDAFIVDYLYPSFSPLVGFFLAGAASYGLYKFLGK